MSTAAEMANLLNQLGNKLYREGRHASALAIWQRCQKITNDHMIKTNVGSCLVELGRVDEGIKFFLDALEEAPMYDHALSNLGRVRGQQGDWAEAESLLTKAILINPKNYTARAERGFMHLAKGDWKKGFVDYEARYDVWPDRYRRFPESTPQWKGEDLDGKTLYVQTEQGVGDTILMSRFLSAVAVKYPTCRIIFCCDPRLQDFFWAFKHEGVIEFEVPGVPFDMLAADYGVHVCSLPGILGITSETIPPDPGLITQRIAWSVEKRPSELPPPAFPHQKKVGLCWAGNPMQNDDHRRSIPFGKIMTLATRGDVMFYSTVFGPARQSMIDAEGHQIICDLANVIPFGAGLVPLARMITEMDAVLTVCTMTAHLAGSLGVPTVLMLSKAPYWTWGREGELTRWYPSVRIVRQTENGEWDDVIERAMKIVESIQPSTG